MNKLIAFNQEGRDPEAFQKIYDYWKENNINGIIKLSLDEQRKIQDLLQSNSNDVRAKFLDFVLEDQQLDCYFFLTRLFNSLTNRPLN